MSYEEKRVRPAAVVLDPHPLWHAAVEPLLARLGIGVVATSTSTDAALAALEQHRPELLVAEIDGIAGSMDGIACIRRARERVPGLAVVVVSGRADAAARAEAAAAGAAAYVLKTAAPDEIVSAVARALGPAVRSVGGPIRPANGRKRNGTSPHLSRRELEILQLVAEGRSNRQVARLLWVSDQTVKFHLANVYRKLGVRSRFEAATWARRHGLLPPVDAANGNGYGQAAPGGEIALGRSA